MNIEPKELESTSNIDEVQNLEIKVIYEILETLQNQQTAIVLEHRKTRKLLRTSILPLVNKLSDLLIIGLLLAFLLVAISVAGKSDIDTRKEILYSLIVGSGASITAYQKWNNSKDKSDVEDEDL